MYFFRLTVMISLLFFLLTIIAMFLYPGGTTLHHHARGYTFFENFLSDLGRVTAISGQSNLPARICFTLALSAGGLGIALFFLALLPFFTGSSRTRWLSRLGAVFGLLASLCFLGVALVPLDLAGAIHDLFIDAALVTFLAAFLFLFLAVLRTPAFPKIFLWSFSVFAVVLLVYVLLIIFGPAPGTAAWVLVQATGQKVIVAFAILIAMIQALSAQRFLVKTSIPSFPRGKQSGDQELLTTLIPPVFPPGAPGKNL